MTEKHAEIVTQSFPMYTYFIHIFILVLRIYVTIREKCG